MLVGYARVSTQDQTLDLQIDALKNFGCEKFFTDVASGAKSDRPGLEEALGYVREGDALVVWRLDRLGRSLQHLIEVINGLESRGVGFRSLQESIDTTTSGGRLVFHIFGALAEFEREIIRERVTAGLAAARARGRKGGRPRAMSGAQVTMARAMLNDSKVSVKNVCATFKVSKATLYRYLSSNHDVR